MIIRFTGLGVFPAPLALRRGRALLGREGHGQPTLRFAIGSVTDGVTTSSMPFNPRLSPLERHVLISFPLLFPDGDTDDLASPGRSREAISYAVQHLMALGLVSASSHEGVHPLAPDYRDAVLTAEGEELRRDLARPRLVRWLELEWKWLLSTVIGLCALGLSLWNFFYPAAK